MEGLVETAAALAGSQQSPSEALSKLSLFPNLSVIAGSSAHPTGANNLGFDKASPSSSLSSQSTAVNSPFHAMASSNSSASLEAVAKSQPQMQFQLRRQNTAEEDDNDVDMTGGACTSSNMSIAGDVNDADNETVSISKTNSRNESTASIELPLSFTNPRSAPADDDDDEDDESETASARQGSSIHLQHRLSSGIPITAFQGASLSDSAATAPDTMGDGSQILDAQNNNNERNNGGNNDNMNNGANNNNENNNSNTGTAAPKKHKSRQFVLASIMAGLTPASIAKTTSRMLGGGRRKSSEANNNNNNNSNSNNTDGSNADQQQGAGSDAKPENKLKASLTGRRKGSGSNPRRWTEEEDERLRNAVAQYGDTRWKEIAAVVGTRDNVQCLQRWRKSLKPGLKKGSWRTDEDELLRQKVQEKLADPTLTWTWVANSIEGRNAKQCRERWQNFLDNSIKRGGWNDEEDRELERLYVELDGRWAKIARNMPGRTENSVKVRYQSLKRSREREATRESAPSDASSTTSSVDVKTNKKKGAKRPSGVPADMEGMVGAARADHSSGWSFVSKFKKRKSASLPMGIQTLNADAFSRPASNSDATSPPDTPSSATATDTPLSSASAATLPLPDIKRKLVRKSAPPSLMNAMQALQQAFMNGLEPQQALKNLPPEVLMHASSSPSNRNSVGSSPSNHHGGLNAHNNVSAATIGSSDAAVSAAVAYAAARAAAPPTVPMDGNSPHELSASTITSTTASPPSSISLPRSHSFPSLQALTQSLGFLGGNGNAGVVQSSSQNGGNDFVGSPTSVAASNGTDVSLNSMPQSASFQFLHQQLLQQQQQQQLRSQQHQ